MAHRASPIAQLIKKKKKSACNAGDPSLIPESAKSKICWGRDKLLTPAFLGFPCGSAGKESACNVGDLGLIPGLGRSPWRKESYPLQYSGLENSTDCRVYGVTKSQTLLSNFRLRFPWWLNGEESTCQCKRRGSGRCPGEANGNPL